MDSLQWMGAVRMRINSHDNASFREKVHPLLSYPIKIHLFENVLDYFYLWDAWSMNFLTEYNSYYE